VPADHQLLTTSQTVKKIGLDAGFDLVGITSATQSKHSDYFRSWLEAGRAGSMRFMKDRVEERLDPSLYLPGAQSVVCCAMNYAVPVEVSASLKDPVKIARYALGVDYHEHIKPRLWKIADYIRTTFPGERTVSGVDTAPILERDLSARAGVGWVGKNTCVINEKLGSWLLLGEVITTLKLDFDDPAIDRCGTCRRCIDACPTHAIVDEYQLDPTKCISYLTIEHAGDIAKDLAEKLSGWMYGCDICQEVCPWNRRAPFTHISEFQPRVPHAVERDQVENWDQQNYWDFTRKTAMRRVKLPQLKRNAQGGT